MFPFPVLQRALLKWQENYLSDNFPNSNGLRNDIDSHARVKNLSVIK